MSSNLRTLRQLAALFLVPLFLACGGGSNSGGSATPQPTFYTVTTSPGAGVHISPTSVQVEGGKVTSFSVAVDPGFSIDSVSGCGGTLSNGVYTTAPIWANGVVTGAAKPTVYTITTSVAPGAHVSPTVALVEHGKTATFTVSVDAGYLLMDASGCGGVLNGGTYTTGPITADGAVTIFAGPDLPIRPGKIVYVVAPDVLADMLPLIQAFMGAVKGDTGCEGILLQSPSDPASIRNFLKSVGNDLRHAFLIGDVPVIRKKNVSPNGTFVNLSDHYYRALEYPYLTPYVDSLGYAVVDIDTVSNLMPSYSPTIALSRIKGLDSTSQLADIRRYLEKNLLLRNNPSQFSRGFTFISAAADGAIDGAKLLTAYQNHPLYKNGEVAFLGGMSAAALKQGFLDALASGKEHCEINLHGNPQEVLFQGLTASDSRDMFASEFASATINTKVISLASCSTGDYSWPDYLAGYPLFSPNSTALLVRADPSVTLYSDSAFAQEARMLDMALGVGRSYMDSYRYTYSGEPPHFLGDPTITLRTVDLSAPRPRLVMQQKRYHQEFRETVTFQASSVNGARTHEDVIFRNLGEQDLIIDGSAYSSGISVNGTFPWGMNSGISGFTAPGIYNDPTIITRMDGSYILRLAPGESKTVRIEFYAAKLSDGTYPIGTNQGVMFFACNDPEIGSFRLDLIAKSE